jgi:hypothetical protein
MKTAIALGTLMLLTGTGLAEAGAGKKGIRPQGTKGVILSVDETAKTFTFRVGKKKDPNAQEITVQFDAKTKFVKFGDTGPAEAKGADLAAMKRVAVVYETKDGKSVATKVSILDLAKKKKG